MLRWSIAFSGRHVSSAAHRQAWPRQSARFGLVGLGLLTTLATGLVATTSAQAAPTIVYPGQGTPNPEDAYVDTFPASSNNAPTTNPNGNGNAVPFAPAFFTTSDGFSGAYEGQDKIDFDNLINAISVGSDAISDLTRDNPGLGEDKNRDDVDDYVGTDPGGNGQDHIDWVARNAKLTQYNALVDQASANSDALSTFYENNPPDTSLATCADQLTPLSYGLSVAGFSTDLAGAVIEAATSPGSWFGLEVASNIIQGVGIGLNLGGIIVEGVANGLPNCEAVYTGSVETYANVVAKMGVNAFDGALNLGYTSADGLSNSYYNGITVGGGAVAGAGFGGDQASTDSASDIAIGNGSHAGDGSSDGMATAIGDGAQANGYRSTAVGAGAIADGEESTALGYNAHAIGDNAIAIGQSTAGGQNGIAMGNGSSSGNGNDNIAIGTGNSIADGIDENTALGSSITIVGGSQNTVLGTGHYVNGSGNSVIGDPDEIVGSNNQVSGDSNFVAGDNNQVIGTNNGTLTADGIVTGGETGIFGDYNQVLGSDNFIGTGTASLILATGSYNQIVGSQNTLTASVGGDAIAQQNGIFGTDNAVDGDYNFSIGDGNEITGLRNFIGGINNTQVGEGNIVLGTNNGNATETDYNTVIGHNNTGVVTNDNVVLGSGNTVTTGVDNAVIGDGSTVAGAQNVALG